MRADRVKDVDQLRNIFATLGSNLNPVLTQLAKTRRAVFVEGKDFRLISAFARKLGFHQIANRSDFAVIPAHGFNPGMVKNFKGGIEQTVGKGIGAAIVFDRDFRSDNEVDGLLENFAEFTSYQHIHERKEIENYVLSARVIQRVVDRRIRERRLRGGVASCKDFSVDDALTSIFAGVKSRVVSQHLSKGVDLLRAKDPAVDRSTLTQLVLEEFESRWGDGAWQIRLVPGKDVLAALNARLQEGCGLTVTPASIVAEMRPDEVPENIQALMAGLERFRLTAV